jgi:uncharacterized protein YbaR (Trm112 family)
MRGWMRAERADEGGEERVDERVDEGVRGSERRGWRGEGGEEGGRGGGRLDGGGGGGQHARVSIAPELLSILACPESKAPLVLGEEGGAAFLFCPTSRLKYRIEGDVPVLLIEEAERLDERAAAGLMERLKRS